MSSASYQVPMSHAFWINGEVLKDMVKALEMTDIVTRTIIPVLKSHSEAKKFILNEQIRKILSNLEYAFII